MRGRPRKHALIHKLDGSYEPARHDNGADTRPAQGQCSPTRRLGVNGKCEFDRVLRAYPPGTLGESDSEPLTQYCEWVQRMFDLRKIEAELEAGKAVRLAAEISKHCMQFACRFGLTPADRGKVKIGVTPQDQSMEKKFLGVIG